MAFKQAYKKKYKYQNSYSRKKYAYKRRYGGKYMSRRTIEPGKGYDTLVNKSNGVMPARYITKHTYNIPVSLVIGAGITQNQIYRGNGIWDPDQSGTGTSASGFTLMSTVYNHHRVYASAIEITACNTGDFPIIFWIVPTRTATAINLAQAKSYPYYKEVILAEQSGGSSVKKILHFCKTTSITDISNRDFDLQASGGANPAQQWYWICGAVAADGATATSCTISVRITYYTEWSGMKAQQT